MPNIEIIGFGLDETYKIREKVLAELAKHYELGKTTVFDEILFTLHPEKEVVDGNGRCKPFVRLYGRSQKELKFLYDIIVKTEISLRVEFVVLVGVEYT
ncbi:MAG TPA: hypothetical protein PKA60_02720 [Candidatus Paceibacterota bacterium]|nr:hypothetical protein [Candidatus Paceibacterota bacterium]